MTGREAGALVRAIRAWGRSEKMVLLMKYADGMSCEEIAAALGVSPAQARRLLQRVEVRARQALAKIRAGATEAA